MREELAYESPKSQTFNRKQIEKCIDRAGYSKNYYLYGYCLFMTEDEGTKVLKGLEEPERIELVITEISDILGIQYLWTDNGCSLMKEYSPNTSEDTGPTGTQIAAYMNHMNGR